MKTLITTAAAVALLGLPLHAQDKSVTLKDQKEKASYSIGMNIGSGLKRQGIEINPEILAQGLKAAYTGTNTALSEKEMQETLMAFQQEMMAKQAEKARVGAEKNIKEGENFLAENKKKEGVKTTASGLQYKVIKEGTGPTPKETDTVVTHYRGTLIDGTEFDSSYKRGEPATFPVNGVIKGWTEALQLMKVGSKWQLFIPASLAYGERGAGPDIGPNSTLIFDIELIDIKK